MIYLDHNATSPLHPKVLEAMQPWLGVPANPSSVHRLGQRAANAIEQAREHVAALIGKQPAQVVFTSGATESVHAWFAQHAGQRIGVGATEHPCVHRAAEGVFAVPIAVDAHGRHVYTGLDGLDAVAVMAANHETGVVSDLAPLAGMDLHVDATAAAGRMPLALDVATVTLSAHKLGGPMGVGALVGDGVQSVVPGTQQRGRRGGTLNTPGIVGFGEAARLALEGLDARRATWGACQEALVQVVEHHGGRVVGPPGLPSIVTAVFDGLPAELVVQALDLRGVAVSAGAACASGAVQESPVLLAMGDPQPDGGVRFSFGWSTDEGTIDALLPHLAAVLEALAPLRT